MRVLLTGSSGWLGRLLAPPLRAAGHAVTRLEGAPGPEPQVVGPVAETGPIARVFDAVIDSGALHKPDIARVLDALRTGAPLPFAQDASYVSPQVRAMARPIR